MVKRKYYRTGPDWKPEEEYGYIWNSPEHKCPNGENLYFCACWEEDPETKEKCWVISDMATGIIVGTSQEDRDYYKYWLDNVDFDKLQKFHETQLARDLTNNILREYDFDNNQTAIKHIRKEGILDWN